MKRIMMILSIVAGFSLPLMAGADTNQRAAADANHEAAANGNQNGAANGSAKIDDAELEKFVKASGQINLIQQKYSQEMQGVQDQEKTQNLQQQAHKDMTKAIVSSGLTLEEYNQLAQKIQQDPELLKKVQGMM